MSEERESKIMRDSDRERDRPTIYTICTAIKSDTTALC